MLLTYQLQTGDSKDLLLRLDSFATGAHRTQGNTCAYQFIKVMIKDMNQRPDEEMQRVKYRERAWSFHALHALSKALPSPVSTGSPTWRLC